MYKVLVELLYDRYNPERFFKRNQIIKINDPERANSLLARGIVEETKNSKDFAELDPVEKKAPAKRTRKSSK